MSRYDQLIQVVQQLKPRTIIEVGTWNGHRAVQLAREALKYGPVDYYGFDLFEEATAETDAAELNVKPHFNVADVGALLRDFHNTEAPQFSWSLVQGDTRETLPRYIGTAWRNMPKPVLAFIDGGHSVETIRSDFEALKWADCVILDDYYLADEEGKIPDVDKFGCNHLLDAIDDKFMLPVGDPVLGGGRVHMGVVGFKPNITVRKQIVVKTKNSVDDGVITAHIQSALDRKLPELEQCRKHGHIAVVVSGGPTFKDHIEEIRARQNAGEYIFCVKTSHDYLIEQGIIPFGCILLDPRPHVLDFVENPHPDVTYFVASQVHPVTLDRLQERGAKVVLYHALVGAGEDKILAGKSMVVGGSTSATRGISVMNSLGFGQFELYGYDSCFKECPGPEYVVTGEGKKPMSVEVNGRAFWTTAELIAQAQDFEKLAQMARDANLIDIDVHGDGMIPHIWAKIKPKRGDFGVIYGNR